MKTNTALALVLVVALAACGPAVDTQTPAASVPMLPVTGAYVVNNHADARDFVVRHIVAFFDVTQPEEWSVQEESATAEGSKLIVYTAESWNMRIEATDNGPDCIVYLVVAEYAGNPGLHWEGSVDACGRIREDVAESKS